MFHPWFALTFSLLCLCMRNRSKQTVENNVVRIQAFLSLTSKNRDRERNRERENERERQTDRKRESERDANCSLYKSVEFSMKQLMHRRLNHWRQKKKASSCVDHTPPAKHETQICSQLQLKKYGICLYHFHCTFLLEATFTDFCAQCWNRIPQYNWRHRWVRFLNYKYSCSLLAWFELRHKKQSSETLRVECPQHGSPNALCAIWCLDVRGVFSVFPNLHSRCRFLCTIADGKNTFHDFPPSRSMRYNVTWTDSSWTERGKKTNFLSVFESSERKNFFYSHHNQWGRDNAALACGFTYMYSKWTSFQFQHKGKYAR